MLGNKEVMARNIQMYMDMNHLTRNELCEALDVKYTTLRDWLKAASYPRIDRIEQMANYFGIQKKDLVEEHHIENPLIEELLRLAYQADDECIKLAIQFLKLAKEKEQRDEAEKTEVW